MNKNDLSPDQREAYSGILTWLHRGTETKQALTFAGYAGCLSGDTVVRYSRGSRVSSRPISLRDLYLKFNGFRVDGQRGAGRWIDLTMPTHLHSLWSDGTISRNRVVAVLASGVKPVMRVDFSNGRHLVLTGDHPVATPGGEFVQAESLSVGDKVLAQGAMLAGNGAGRRSLDMRPPRVIINTRYHPIGSRKRVLCNGVAYDYVRVARAKLVVEATMNNVSYEEFVHALKHNAGASKSFKYLPKGMNVHHIDEDTLNDDISNLSVLPHAEHARIHGKESHKHFHKEFTRAVKVIRVRKMGEEATYDVQMEPPANNFVANGIIVHNTGKTTVVSVLAHELPQPLAFCAFTGKASSVLGRKLKEHGVTTTTDIAVYDEAGERLPVSLPYCGTIHGLIYRPCPECMPKEVIYGHRRINLNCRALPAIDRLDENSAELADRVDLGPCLGCDPPPPKPRKEGRCRVCDNARFIRRQELDRQYKLIVVDEASMVSDEMLESMLRYDVPILAVGDHGQLEPVRGSGSLMRHPDIRLEKIHRQAESNPIIALSKYVRENGDVHTRFCDDKHVWMVSDRGLGDFVAKSFVPGRDDMLSMVVICWTNRTRATINRSARHAIFGSSDLPPQKGDAVICLKNKPPIFNGMRGIIASDVGHDDNEKRPKWTCQVSFPEDGLTRDVEMSGLQFYAEKTIDFDRASELGVAPLASLGDLYDYGYALTCHKMQGSQAEKVAVVLDGVHRMPVEKRTRWIYTAVTRSSDKLVIFR